jgi:hypothetical protein
MKILSALVLAAVLVAAPAYAHDADGKWSGTVVTDMGEIPVTFEFKVDGTMVTGTTMGFDGSPVQIKNGKVDGATITYSVTFDFGGMPLEITYKGTVAPAEITMTAEAAGMPVNFVLKKG